MTRPLLLIHGYSATGLDFTNLYWALVDKKVDVELLNVGNYISLNNEITIEDIAEGMQRAISLTKLDASEEFDAIVHSTGMLVVRAWLAHQNITPDANDRLKRLKHLIGLAPATWGSPQAHKGRTWLGALVKGSKTPGPDFLNAGDLVLDGLELASKFTWDLAHADLLGPEPYFGTGSNTPYVTVFIGNTPYTGLSSLANDPGTDGTVRWSGCGLNTRKIALDLTKTPTDEHGKPRSRVTMSPWASESRLNVPMLAVDGRDHGTLVSNPDAGMVDRIASFLEIGNIDQYNAWLAEAQQWSAPAQQQMLKSKGHLFAFWETEELDGWQQFVVRARDAHGDPVKDYMIEVYELGPDGVTWQRAEEISVDVHAYGADPSYRCLHVQLPKGITTTPRPMQIRIQASTGTDVMTYQGYGSDDQKMEMRADSDPVTIDISDALKDKDATLFHPFTTTLVEVVLNRVPYPFDKVEGIFEWLPPFPARQNGSSSQQ
ncbi:esterase/lipase family protein [Acidicapsa dinghuensis]|uniref:Esterase/lipase family protein n=1 Tax=Acidicapsa dinghuensis TaxID=2218256 RepID=A0ABW1EKP0_9BACT|nr:hypothetical protein [Acidicapsa dinghuensis]